MSNIFQQQKNLYMNVYSSTIHQSQKSGNNPNVHQQMNEKINIHTLEYYLAIKRNKALTHAAIWMNLENPMLNVRSQTHSHIVCDSIYMKHPQRQEMD